MSATLESRRPSVTSSTSSLSTPPYTPAAVIEEAELVRITVQRPLYSPAPVIEQAEVVRMSLERPVLRDLVVQHHRHTSARQSRASSTDQSSGFGSQHSRSSSTSSVRSCEGMSENQTKQLWRCMLELQERYGCYNSRRIDVAIEAEDFDAMMPNKFIIDTLNDSVHELPDEGWDMLQRHFAAAETASEERPRRRKFWQRNSVNLTFHT